MQLQFQCLSFKDLSLDQLYDLLQLRQAVFVVEQFCPYLDADNMDRQAYHLLGYDAAGKLLAYARLLPPGVSYTNYSSIGRIVTSPSARGNRLGYQLIEIALRELTLLFPSYACKISAQSHLQSFYASFGFVVAGTGYLEDGIPHLPMLRIF